MSFRPSGSVLDDGDAVLSLLLLALEAEALCVVDADSEAEAAEKDSERRRFCGFFRCGLASQRVEILSTKNLATKSPKLT